MANERGQRGTKIPKLGEKSWLITINAIILAALMVWLRGWWQSLRYYADIGDADGIIVLIANGSQQSTN